MTAATNRRNRRAQARSRRRAGVVRSASARQRRADTTTFTYSDPMFLTAVDGPSGRLATYVYDSESKRRRIYEGAAFTTIGWDYLQSYSGSKPLDYHTVDGLNLAQRSDEDYAEYLPDFLGTVVAYADESGSALAEARYKPHGLPLWSDGPVEDYAFGWVGQWGYRQADDLQYVRLRHLLRTGGQWTTLDLIPRHLSPYAYADGNPSSSIDPSGLCQLLMSSRFQADTYCRTWDNLDLLTHHRSITDIESYPRPKPCTDCSCSFGCESVGTLDIILTTRFTQRANGGKLISSNQNTSMQVSNRGCPIGVGFDWGKFAEGALGAVLGAIPRGWAIVGGIITSGIGSIVPGRDTNTTGPPRPAPHGLNCPTPCWKAVFETKMSFACYRCKPGCPPPATVPPPGTQPGDILPGRGQQNNVIRV